MKMEILGLKSIAKFCSGMWDYLTARVIGRTAIEIERERNRGTTEAIRALPLGAVLVENEPGGRMRMIQMPHPPTHTPPVELPIVIESSSTTGELNQ